MKNHFLLLILLFATLFNVNAQDARCGFDERFDQMLSDDPTRVQTVLELQDAAQEIKRQRLNGESERSNDVRIIPVVFHVIHQGGSENISYEQIEDQVRILTEDYTRTNADTVNTRELFKPVAADAKVEFRLAKKDPQGNCTDGVVRIWSNLTNNAPESIKSLSYWNSDRYFNVWVVNSIENDGPGLIIGYAQFPGFGAAETDGVVIRSDYVGDIGTAAGRKGRAMSHEVGHWLGLFHTFQGGCNGGLFGGDGVDDTPPVAEGGNPGCPFTANTCDTDSPDLLDQVENYMDYTSGSCQNMLTFGQKDVIDAALNGSRSQIHSTSNLSFTGVDSPGPSMCKPIAHFYTEKTLICAGNPITFTDDSYNGEVTTYDWQFPGATPSSSNDENPIVTYNAAGTYTVTQTVSNAQGNDSYTQTDYVTVLPSEAAIQNYFSFEGFEETEEDYIILSDNLGATWAETNAAFTDNQSIYLNNYNGNPLGSQDEFQLPSMDLTNMNDPDLYFQLSYKQRTGGASDNLRVYASRDCGDSWSLRFNKSGASLATVSGTQGSPFTPSSSSQWELIDVNLSTFANDEHVLIKFRGTSDEGNNIYIDDIQISGPLGVSDVQEDFEFTVGPNPMTVSSQVNLKVVNAGDYSISLTDVTGKLITTVYNGELNFGSHQFEIERQSINAGVYLIQVDNRQGRLVQKLIVQ
jgi:PKD repeat protein